MSILTKKNQKHHSLSHAHTHPRTCLEREITPSLKGALVVLVHEAWPNTLDVSLVELGSFDCPKFASVPPQAITEQAGRLGFAFCFFVFVFYYKPIFRSLKQSGKYTHRPVRNGNEKASRSLVLGREKAFVLKLLNS